MSVYTVTYANLQLDASFFKQTAGRCTYTVHRKQFSGLVLTSGVVDYRNLVILFSKKTLCLLVVQIFEIPASFTAKMLRMFKLIIYNILFWVEMFPQTMHIYTFTSGF